MKYTFSFFSAMFALSLCSCTSTSVQPIDPFAAHPTSPPYSNTQVQLERQEEKISGTNSEVLGMQPEYKPVYETPPTPQPTELVPRQQQDVIRRVNYLTENEAPPSYEPTSSQMSSITIDPELNERGAIIVADQRNGQESFQGTWRPPSVSGFWPQQEYLADGGDENSKVAVKEDWTVLNLQLEDTVAHFDTVDGRTVVEPSNRVHLYAPRFGSVRKIEGVLGSGQITALSGANNNVALKERIVKEQLGWTAQEASTGYARTQTQLGGVGGRKASTGAAMAQGLGSYGGVDAVMLYSNWMTQTSIGSAELAYLAEGSASARAWQGTEGVKVRINTLAPQSASSEQGAESFFQVKEDGSQSSKLRLIKVASKKSAQPGEIVEFTLRFDNIGTLPIGNVTILDNLTTRLEFLPGTAKSSLPAAFVAEPNDGSSFTLRWEITDPLLPLQFGVVQFQCRVR